MRFGMVTVLIAAALTGCGGGSDASTTVAGEQKVVQEPAEVYAGTRQFSFAINVKPGSLARENGIRLYNSWSHVRADTYPIRTQADLDAFNGLVSERERISLNDLTAYTYVLVRGPASCGSRYEVAGSAMVDGIYVLTLQTFTRQGVVCPAVMVDDYAVFRLEKQP